MATAGSASLRRRVNSNVRRHLINGACMFKRIDHIELLTATPERTIAFYVGVLDFHERERVRIPETPFGPLDLVYLELGGTTVEVMCYPESKAIPARSA